MIQFNEKDEISSEEIIHCSQQISKWIERNGWDGYDPYDIKSVPLVLWISDKAKSSKIFTIIREILFEIFLLFPKFLRRLFRIRKKINPKAMGLMASGYLELYRSTKEDKFLQHGEHILKWLTENKVTTSNGIGWGYPFDWQSTNLIPAGTPNGIVTTAVAAAYWEYYRVTNNKNYLDICKQIAGFLRNLPIDKISENKLCFSYTPLFINHVHNLNLFVAEFLLKVGIELNHNDYIKHAEMAMNYTLSDQRPDGSFDYNGPPERPQNFVDNYHTGFVLRMLHSIWLLTKNEKVYLALKKGYTYYLENFFEKNSIPKITPDRLYRVDIHSCSEALLTLSLLHEEFGKGLQTAKNVFKWTYKELWNKKGFFYHGIFKSKLLLGLTFKSKIAYMRWGQSWMFYSLIKFYQSNYAGQTKDNG